MRLSKRERRERNKTAALQLRADATNDDLRWVVIDCSFNHIMSEFEQTSLVVQIQESYSHLRKHTGQAKLCVCSVSDALDSKMAKQGASEWVLRRTTHPLEQFLDEVSSKNVIVMSPDADKELSWDDIRNPRSVFVIGGIVDRLVSRNETSHKAIKLGLEARRLPIDPALFVNKVFNIDSVVHFLLRSFQASPNKELCREDMIRLLASVIPERKKKEISFVTPRAKSESSGYCPSEDPSNKVKLDAYRVLDLFR
jgi:hypothetical protein